VSQLCPLSFLFSEVKVWLPVQCYLCCVQGWSSHVLVDWEAKILTRHEFMCCHEFLHCNYRYFFIFLLRFVHWLFVQGVRQVREQFSIPSCVLFYFLAKMTPKLRRCWVLNDSRNRKRFLPAIFVQEETYLSTSSLGDVIVCMFGIGPKVRGLKPGRGNRF
jgi:hypothetical protein